MFGCVGCYLGGRLVLVLADRREPWQGLLLPVERDVHPQLLRSFPQLLVHPVLRKWLYLPERADGFEAVASEIVRRIEFGDDRFGVEPPLKLPPRGSSGSRGGSF
jgi:hypothetical protein